MEESKQGCPGHLEPPAQVWKLPMRNPSYTQSRPRSQLAVVWKLPMRNPSNWVDTIADTTPDVFGSYL